MLRAQRMRQLFTKAGYNTAMGASLQGAAGLGAVTTPATEASIVEASVAAAGLALCCWRGKGSWGEHGSKR